MERTKVTPTIEFWAMWYSVVASAVRAMGR